MAENKTTNESELPENQVEAGTQEKPSFLQRRWRDVGMLVALICLWIFTGISVWFSILFLAFFWGTTVMAGKPANRDFLAKVMKVIFVLALLNVVVITFLPRFHSTRPTTLAFVDQTLSGLTPKDVKVKAKDIFTVEQRRASETFLRYYTFLLEEDRTKEAADTLAGFEKHWKFRPDTEEQDRRFGLSSQPQQHQQSQTPAPIPMAARDSVFYPGTYYIDVDGETPFYINIASTKSCGKYNLASQNGGYFVVYDNGERVYDEPGKTVAFPYRENPRFKLISRNKTTIRMVVS